MTTWIRPTKTKKVSDDFHDHVARGSVNPGVDYVVGTGVPVVAVADAVVTGVTTSIKGAGGRMVWLNFGNGYCADYLHLSRVDVKKGQRVTQGQVLGLSGGSGKGSEKGYGAHLHFAFRLGKKHVQGKGNMDYEAFLKKQAAAAPAVAPAVVAAPVAPVAPVVAPAVAAAPVVETVAVAAPAVAVARPTLKVGSKGADVKYLQKKLGITADGDFGPNTKASVVAFQKKHGLTADGIVGPNTWKAVK
jgi:hypothetical protein